MIIIGVYTVWLSLALPVGRAGLMWWIPVWSAPSGSVCSMFREVFSSHDAVPCLGRPALRHDVLGVAAVIV